MYNKLIAPLLILGLAGCSMAPNPISAKEHNSLATKDHLVAFSKQEPITAPVTLYQAMARAIKYNLEHRLKLMEAAVSQSQMDLAKFDMLPKLVASAGYTSRNKVASSVSKNISSGVVSDIDNATSSADRSSNTANLTMSWNILDFGVSYYQAKQDKDRFLISQERRRKVIHNLVQEVRYAYWRAVGAQKLEGRIKNVTQLVKTALTRSEIIEKERLNSPLETLRYQKSLLETLRQLETVRTEMTLANIELATLMNIPPGTPFRLDESSIKSSQISDWSLPLEKMESMAMLNRPELREENYQARIGTLETRKAIIRMFPGLEISGSAQHDGNSFLINNQWTQAGAKITWTFLIYFPHLPDLKWPNLKRVLSIPVV
jgi:outer membrane protein TolC